MKPIIILFFCTLFFCCNQSAKKPAVPEDSLQYYPPTPATLSKEDFRNWYRKLDTFFDTTILEYSHFNGQILVAKEGAVLFEKYIGKSDLRKNDTMKANTSLHIASTSKTFTGVAILRLIQEGKLGLNDSLSRYFPELPYPGITIKMLLNHRSGLPNYVHFMDRSDWNKKIYVTNKDVLHFMSTTPPNKEASPDRKFSYCNTNYLLLALLIEKIAGKPYPEYMKEKFFEPLEMKDTYVFTLKDTLTATPSFKADGYLWTYDFLDGTYGDKNVYTTARDLLKWDQALYTDQVINKDLLDAAFTSYSNERPSVHNYGLGFRLMNLPNNKKIVYHFGKWHGCNAAFARLIDEKVTIIMLGNRFNRGIYGTAHLSYDLFGEYFQKTSTEEEETDTIPLKKTARAPVKKETKGRR